MMVVVEMIPLMLVCRVLVEEFVIDEVEMRVVVDMIPFTFEDKRLLFKDIV